VIYIFDIDGTLSDLTHRLPLIQQAEPDWDGFFLKCGEDKPIRDVIRLCRDLWHKEDHEIIFITGRSEICRKQTTVWLEQYINQHAGNYIWMRRKGDHRPDHVVKLELLDQILEYTDVEFSDIAGVFEDRSSVVAAYRARGLRVYQVAEGNF
jgi:hypothetical protein